MCNQHQDRKTNGECKRMKQSAEMYIQDSLGGKHSFNAEFSKSDGKLIPTEETVCDYFKACKSAVVAEAQACPIKVPYELWNDTKISLVEGVTE